MPSVKTTLRSEVEARSFIRDYMKAQYRPYSTTDIQLNLHNQITKSKLAAILDSLLEEGELIVKTVGKTSYYCYKELFQAQEEPCDEDKREIEDHLARVHSEIESLTTELAQLTGEPTNERLKQAVAHAHSKLASTKAALEQHQKKAETHNLSKEHLHYAKLVQLYRQRKKMFTEFCSRLDEIMVENGNVMERAEIDSDELRDHSMILQ